MAAAPVSRSTESISSSPARQAIFTQEKLEGIFIKTHKYLRPYKPTIELAQDVLVWKKPLVSAVLYIVVHWLFIIYVNSTATLITAIGNVLFWVLVGDVLLRAASKDGFNGERAQNETERRRGRGSRGVTRAYVTPRLESVLIQSHRPRGPGELPSFEILCLWISEVIMWLDNLVLAFRHWSINEPVVFTFVLALPGLVLSLVGKYMPTTVFLYLQVIILLVLPYIEHHCLRQRTLAYISAQYPGVLRRARSLWLFLKAITVNRDKSEDPELSLAQGVGDLRTQNSLQEAFEQATVQPAPPPAEPADDDIQLPELASALGGRPENEVASSPSVPDQFSGQSRARNTAPTLNALHSTSLDSLTLDSFAGGHGDFPSITDIDNSLALPQFPSGDYVNSIMPTISEEGESLSLHNSNLEFESINFTDGHSSQLPPQASHPLVESHRADPISAQPSAPPRATGFDSLGFSMYTTTGSTGQSSFSGQTSEQPGYTSSFVPPPTYQQVATGSPDAGVTVDWTPGPNQSSTPNVQDGSDSWGVKKRPTSSTY